MGLSACSRSLLNCICFLSRKICHHLKPNSSRCDGILRQRSCGVRSLPERQIIDTFRCCISVYMPSSVHDKKHRNSFIFLIVSSLPVVLNTSENHLHTASAATHVYMQYVYGYNNQSAMMMKFLRNKGANSIETHAERPCAAWNPPSI